MQTASEIIYREVEGAYLLYQMDNDMIFGLNNTGSRVWQLLQEGVSVERIAEVLTAEFDVAPAVCRQDLAGFLEKLFGHGLVRQAD